MTGDQEVEGLGMLPIVLIFILIVLIIALWFAPSLVTAKSMVKNPGNDDRLSVYAHCKDAVVCYALDKNAGISCISMSFLPPARVREYCSS